MAHRSRGNRTAAVAAAAGDDLLDGQIVRLVPEKGFGFIRDAHGSDYFFHHSEVIGTTWAELKQGAAVAFLPVDNGKKGLAARRVELV